MKFLNLIINNPYKIFISIFMISCLGINGIQNFKLDASSDALLIEMINHLKFTVSLLKFLETMIFYL